MSIARTSLSWLFLRLFFFPAHTSSRKHSVLLNSNAPFNTTNSGYYPQRTSYFDICAISTSNILYAFNWYLSSGPHAYSINLTDLTPHSTPTNLDSMAEITSTLKTQAFWPCGDTNVNHIQMQLPVISGDLLFISGMKSGVDPNCHSAFKKHFTIFDMANAIFKRSASLPGLFEEFRDSQTYDHLQVNPYLSFPSFQTYASRNSK